MDYQLENLGPERFQEICQSLLTRNFPNLQCFPIGQRDGGRDAVAFITHTTSDEFIVFQVKYVRRPQAENDPHKWLVDILRKEAPKISKLIPRGAKEFYLLTNVPGTAFPDSGSIDTVQALLTENIEVPSQCWWREDIVRRLDNAWNLKWVYPEILSGPDILRFIVERGLAEEAERRTNVIRAFVRDQHDREQEVRFKQVELQNQLLDLFIDVPVVIRDKPIRRSPGRREYRAFHLIAREMQIETEYPGSREPAVGAATMLLHPIIQEHIPRIVLEGAPGQGKSTIAQYVCQLHRQRLLGESVDDPRVSESHRLTPVRLPFKIDLRDFAVWLKKRDPFSSHDSATTPDQWQRSLESFLAALVRHHSGGGDFSVSDLLAVAKLSAVLIVFDGLDEVADIGTRQEVVDEINKGVTRLDENAVSLQVVVTSRPAAFANSPGMSEHTFRYFELASITRRLIDEYAAKWLKARRLSGREASDVRRILRDKLDQPHLRELARNPMQLAILLSLIHTRGSSLPDKRTALYDSYVELFFNREAEKSEVVREYRDLLINIHGFLAWILHSESEIMESQGSVASERLRQLVEQYLRDEQHDTSLAASLFTGMVERVVALVSRVEGTYEFEVQPLREYFAARHLYNTAPYSPPGSERQGTLPDIFDALARNFYWLNVARFFAGCYSKGELPSLVDRLEELSRQDGYRHTSHPQVLAATLLSDWVFAQHPKSMKKVVALILDGLGLRHMLAAEKRYRRGTPLLLPKQNGNEELVERCFELLRDMPPEDYAFLLIDVVNENAAHSDKINRWYDAVVDFSEKKRTHWMKYGFRLGVLPELTSEQLDFILSDCEIGMKRMSLLIQSGQHRFFERSEEQFNMAVECVLGRHFRIRASKKSRSIVETLAQVVDASRYAHSFARREPVALKDIWRYYGPPTEHPTSSNPPSFDLARKVASFVKTADNESQRTAKEWATELGPWDRLVERGRKLFGEQWALYCLSAMAAGIRSKTETGKPHSDILASSAPLCQRARYARLKAGNATWWAAQLDKSKSELEEMYVMLMLLAWGGESVLTKLCGEIDNRLQTMPSDKWRKLYEALQLHVNIGEYDQRKKVLLDLSLIPRTKLSERTIVSLGLRAKPAFVETLYDQYLSEYNGDDPVVLKYCQRVILKRAKTDPTAWKQVLSIISRSYTKGAVSDRFYGYRFVQQVGKLPLNYARKIVEQADMYPSELVSLAESVCRRSLTIEAVGKVAQREEWFSE